MTTAPACASKAEAFILTGSLLAICRAPAYVAELSRRGLRILVITPASWRAQAIQAMADPAHPLSRIEDVAFVDGGVEVEGSFVAGVIAAAQEWRTRYAIVGVYAVGETLVEPTGLLADALGVPSPGLRATRACRSKYLQRWYLPEFSPVSVTVPAGRRECPDLGAVTFPAIVKPASRHSSSGVLTVRDAAELRVQLRTYPAKEVVLVEDRVAGEEFSVESLMQNGKVVFASVTRKTTTEAYCDAFVELSHTVPCPQAGPHEVLLEANDRMLRGLACEDGITHAEWRIDGAGRPILMEVAARTPGDGLAELYLLATGLPLEPEIMRIALGEHASYPSPRRYARQVYLEHPTGALVDVTVDWPGVAPAWLGEAGIWPMLTPGAASEPPTLRAVFVLKERGSELGALHSSGDRAVTFFIDAASAAELDQLDAEVQRAVTIHTTA
jgi:hypothetical protein